MKSLKLIILLFFSAIMLFCSCNKVSEPAIQTIDLTGPVSKEVLKLTDIATDIEYVPLEATAESLIQRVRSFSVSHDYILIWDQFSQAEKVLLFDRQGKFLRPISRKGKGPGEFNGIRQVSFSADKNSILILAANELNKFNLEGILLETIKLENWPSSFAELSEKYLVTYSYPSNISNGNYSFNLINHEGKTERQLFHLSESRFNTNGNLNIYGPYRFHDTLSFYTRRMDTIFGIDPDCRIWPRFVFKQNNWSVEEQVRGQPERLPASVVVVTFREMEDHIYIFGQKFDMMKCFLYSKKDRTIWKLTTGIPNDIDGGPDDFTPERADQDHFYLTEPPGRFLNPPGDSLRTVIPCKYPEKQEAYRKFVSTLTEESNPVLVIVSLRKEKGRRQRAEGRN